MREFDFLPEWYPAVRRQRSVLRMQVYASATVVVAGVAALLVSYHQCEAAQQTLTLTNARAEQAVKEVHQLDEMLSLQNQLVTKRQIVSELGLPVELGRVVSEFNECLPREVSFTDIDIKTTEASIDSISERAKQGGNKTVSRRLEISLKGLAPTESEVTAFWSRLIQRPFFTEVRLVNSVERTSGEHRWRYFEITLAIPLDDAG
jgi:Tfp pilus assembly protein PilN